MKSNNISTTVATPAKPLYNKPLSTRALKYETYHNSQLKIRPMLKSKDFILLLQKSNNSQFYYSNCHFEHQSSQKAVNTTWNLEVESSIPAQVLFLRLNSVNSFGQKFV